MTIPANIIRIAIKKKTAASKGVLLLKWEGTPRHCCMATKNTSPKFASPSAPASSQPQTHHLGRKVMIQATDKQVKPKDSPKRIGLRHEMSPSKEPPVTMNTPVWNTALTTTARNR